MDPSCAAEVQYLATLVWWTEPGDGVGALGEGNARFQASRNRGQSIPDVVPAKQGQNHRCMLFPGGDFKAYSFGTQLLDVCRP